jgi:uncharacterized protein YpmS
MAEIKDHLTTNCWIHLFFSLLSFIILYLKTKQASLDLLSPSPGRCVENDACEGRQKFQTT